MYSSVVNGSWEKCPPSWNIEKKQRTKDLSQLFHSYNPYDHKVLVPKDPLLMGKMVEVNIYEAGKHFMKGQPVSDARVYTASITRPLAKGEVSGLTGVFRHAPQNGTNWKAHPSAEIPVKTPLGSWMALQLPWQQEGGGLKILSVSLALLAALVMFYYGGMKTEL